MIIPVSLNSDDWCELPNLDIGPSEDKTFRIPFLRKLELLGLRSVKLVIFDAEGGRWQVARLKWVGACRQERRRIVSDFIANVFAC